MPTRALSNRSLAMRAGIVVLAILVVATGCKRTPPEPPKSDIVVQAHFMYQDSNGPREIIGSRVEVWRYAPRPPAGWGWGNDYYGYTDDAGKFSASFPFTPGVKYAIRVFPWNYAARCCYSLDSTSLKDELTGQQYAQPPSTLGATEARADKPGQILSWDHMFSGHYWAGAFNIVETIRHARYYFEQHRERAEAAKEPLHTAHIGRGGCAHWGPLPCMYPASGDIFITSPFEFDDYVIVHEYAHYLQYDVGSLAWIISLHNGCTATGPPPFNTPIIIGSPAHSVSFKEELAWLEGFADWYAWLLEVKIGPLANVRFHGSDVGKDGLLGDTSTCPESSPPDSVRGQKLERHVGSMLVDLTDSHSLTEPQDRADNLETVILRIMDVELDTPGWPTTWGFYSAASKRWFNGQRAPLKDLDDIYDLNLIDRPQLN